MKVMMDVVISQVLRKSPLVQRVFFVAKSLFVFVAPLHFLSPPDMNAQNAISEKNSNTGADKEQSNFEGVIHRQKIHFGFFTGFRFNGCGER